MRCTAQTALLLALEVFLSAREGQEGISIFSIIQNTLQLTTQKDTNKAVMPYCGSRAPCNEGVRTYPQKDKRRI